MLTFVLRLHSGVLIIYFLQYLQSYAELGWVMAIPVFIVLITDIPTSYLFDNISRRLSILLGKCCVVFFIVCLLFPNYWTFILAGIFVGMSNSFFSGAVEAMIIENFQDNQDKDKLLSFFSCVKIILNMLSIVGILTGL